MNERPTLKVDLSRATRKVDTLELKAEARRSMGLLGPPVSVTKDPEPRSYTKAILTGVALAFVAGGLLARCEDVPPPSMPPPVRPAHVVMTLKAVELPPPRGEALPRLLVTKKTRRSSIAEPLFSKGTK